MNILKEKGHAGAVCDGRCGALAYREFTNNFGAVPVLRIIGFMCSLTIIIVITITVIIVITITIIIVIPTTTITAITIPIIIVITAALGSGFAFLDMA